MDVRCPICGEPWDTDELHDVEGMSFSTAVAAFRKEGCHVFLTSHNETKAHPAIPVLWDMFEEDIDGLAAMTDDLVG